MKLVDTVDMIDPLWNYVSEKIGENKATEFMAQFGMDNPYILKTRNLDEWKNIIDKIVLFRGIIKNGGKIK
jgi:hypothetical protein